MKELKRKRESGVLVVEAAIVVTVVTMFIAVMLYICMILYQQSLVNIMANQTASNIAQVYGNTLRDPFTGYVDADGVHEEVTYANLRNQAYMDVIEQKADAAALYRLKSSRVLTTGETEVSVQVVPKTNELLKDQVVVTIRDRYVLPLVSFFGVSNNALTFEATGRADCTDLLEYLTGVPALGTTDGNAVAFSETECRVNFYLHYGDTRPLKTVTVLRGNSINYSTDYSHSTMPTRPTQDRMRFTKWVTEDGHVFTGDSIVSEDMDVYGLWECTVTFDPDGGTVTPTGVIATVFGDIELPVAQRENCTFAGWYTAKNGEGELFTGTNIQGDITVYAKWVCTVVFNPDGGSVSPTSYDVVYGKSLQNSGYAAPTPTRSGCTFAGWFTQPYGGGTAFANTAAITAHTVVVAKWNCVVVLNANGGTVNGQASQSQTVVAGTKMTLPTPNRGQSGANGNGWRFGQWNTQANGTGSQHSTEFVVTGATTLYAQWSCVHKDNVGNSRYVAGARVLHLCRTTQGGAVGGEKSYQVYNCQDCSNSYNETIPNKHYINPSYLVNTIEFLGTDASMNDFTGTCNVDHLKVERYWGIRGFYSTGFYYGWIYNKYHITCRYCGLSCPPVFWDNIDGTNVYKEIYWVGTPSEPITQCWDPSFVYEP